jgi:riboflavin kinase/FMN adenylyltransferase
MDQLPFTFGGFVQKNKGRGRKLGFPTANLEIPLDLPEGIFVGYTKYKSQQLPSLIFIGAPITFKELDKKAEIYILNYSEKIYDEFIEIIVEKKLRNNIQFNNKEDLIKQMEKDEKDAKAFFKKK